MDSFFSLFDPNDGAGKGSSKSKGDTPKGRRRGRKCSGKSETLPEESSFLCEPDLSTEMLVKDGSYIDCYYRDEKSDSRQDNTKMRRRNSGRKSRRKKSKVSPANDLARDGWSETDTAGPTTEGGLVAETGGFVTEAGGFVAENGGLVKETGGFGKETGGFVTENGGFVTEKIRLAIETGGHVNETGGFVNKIRGFVTEIRGFVTETGRFATEIEGPDHQETDAGIPVKDTSKCKTKWNNRSTISKNVGNIGKNVNDLKKETDSEFKTCKRKNSCDSNSTVTGDVGCKAINNVIDKLERVGLKDDMYLAGDFNTDDLENDGFSSSEDYDESYDDSTSESDSGSADEVYGSLPPEPRFGNVEYKLQLVNVCEKRFQHLVTQLKWRLRSGGGLAVYLLGVSDCGALRGLRGPALRASVRTLRAMGAAIGARILSVTARRVREQRAVAEVILRKLPHSQQSELRVAVMGADEAGKSTLIGVLTQGELDNGRGSARLNMFRHLHEVRSGRTSSLSHEILGFDAQGNVVNYGCSELMTAERIGERSAKLVSFLDLAGHSKYQRTTLHGLTGYCPHYAMLVISATAGITSITEEHIGVLLALDLPFFCVITKCELAPPASAALTGRLGELLAPAGKKPLLITNEQLARSCVAQEGEASTTDHIGATVAVFPVSCVLGTGLSALHAALLELRAPSDCNPLNFDDEACEFQIDEIFHVGESSGPVVGGLLASGTLREGDSLLLGPMESGSFVRTCVRSIYRNRVPHSCVGRGQSASLGLPEQLIHLRPGMVLLSIPKHYQSADYEKPSFGGCAPGTCRRKAQASLQPHLQIKSFDNSKNIKNVRRKNKNIIQDIAKAEKSLVKIDPIEDSNLYKSDSEKNDRKIIKKDIYNEVPDKNTKATDINTNMTDKTDINIIEPDINGNTAKSGDNVDDNVGEVKKCEEGSEITEECQCRDEVLLEDPNDPRGCMFFQASIHVLRHSTAICPGFQCTVHVGNVRQTAIIEGILTCGGSLRCGQSASCLVRWARCPEYLARGRRLLLTAGGGTRAIGRITQIFPYVP